MHMTCKSAFLFLSGTGTPARLTVTQVLVVTSFVGYVAGPGFLVAVELASVAASFSLNEPFDHHPICAIEKEEKRNKIPKRGGGGKEPADHYR